MVTMDTGVKSSKLARSEHEPERAKRVARVDIVIPVYNEAHVLGESISRLHAFLSDQLAYRWRIVIANNASTDDTLAVARQLSGELGRVSVVHLEQKGRGRALRHAWLESPADVLTYMDVDLSTDLTALPALVQAISNEGYDLATGSRLARGASTTRSLKREAISRTYNLLIKAVLWTRFSDAQCGFKAISRRAAADLLPLVRDDAWFFDTELLVLAEKKGYRIKDIPVHWVEDPDTRVNLGRTIGEDLRGLWRLRTRPVP